MHTKQKNKNSPQIIAHLIIASIKPYPKKPKRIPRFFYLETKNLPHAPMQYFKYSPIITIVDTISSLLTKFS